MKTKNDGFSLIVAIIAVVLLASLGVVGLMILSTESEISTDASISSKALFVADAGIQDVIYKIVNDSSYRASPTSVTDTIGSGAYTVTVSKASDIYTLTSVGAVNNAVRRVTQVVEYSGAVPDAFSYAFSSYGGNPVYIGGILFAQNTYISGDAYNNGNMYVFTRSDVVDGLVYADSVGGGGNYTEASGPPDPVPEYPELDTTWYDQQIADAEASGPSDLTLNDGDVLELNGGTFYYDDIEVKPGATINGPGTIVATDDIVVSGSRTKTATISEDVTMISQDDITIKRKSVVEEGSVIYAKDDVTIEKDGWRYTAPVVTASVIAGDLADVTSATVTGIILADRVNLGQPFDFHAEGVIYGSIVTNEFINNAIWDTNIYFDEDYIPDNLPTGLTGGSSVNLSGWQEVGPSS